MRRKEMIVINLLLVSLVGLFGVLTFGLSVNEGMGTLVAGIFKPGESRAEQEEDRVTRCTRKEQIEFSDAEDDPHIVKLMEYQRVCQSFVSDTLMIFTGFPENTDTAETSAAVIAKKLILLHQAGVKPLVVAEPYTDSGAVSYRRFLEGRYDQAISEYFQKIRALGVTDEMMGTWVPFPESNTPSWDNKDTQPRDFALCVNKYLSRYKEIFPKAGASVLLNATTYDPNDIEYNNGDYLDLTPYVQDIDKKLVDSVGIQGFPWVSNASVKRREIFRASEFLQPDLAIAAARELHTRSIWFNTGSFASKYTNDPAKTVTLSTSDRKAILDSILEVAGSVKNYQQNSYRVAINLFSEDKSHVAESTDWSYFQNDDAKTILKTFLAKADELDVPMSLYDKAK